MQNPNNVSKMFLLLFNYNKNRKYLFKSISFSSASIQCWFISHQHWYCCCDYPSLPSNKIMHAKRYYVMNPICGRLVLKSWQGNFSDFQILILVLNSFRVVSWVHNISSFMSLVTQMILILAVTCHSVLSWSLFMINFPATKHVD